VLTVPRPLPRHSHARSLTTTLDFRSIVADGGRSQLVAAFASAHVDLALVQHTLVCTLVALLMACLLEKHDAQLAALSQPTPLPAMSVPAMSQLTPMPTQLPHQSPQDEPMDVDPALPCSSSPLLSLAPQTLPFPGELVAGARVEVQLNL
jgi:hypothetical protein